MEHFLKFLVVGGVGFVINTVVLIGGVRFGLRPSVSGPMGAELAIVSNFLLNNFWTFSDRKITSWGVLPSKFIQFNVLSLGSVIIQFLFLKTGERMFGLERFKRPFVKEPVFRKVPLSDFWSGLPLIEKFSLYLIFYMAGVGVGLVWNFAMYSLVIWRQTS